MELERSRVASFSSLLGLHKDIYILSNADKQNQRGARWPLPHHYQTHTANCIHIERSVQIYRTIQEQGGHFLFTTRLTQRNIPTQTKISNYTQNQRSRVASFSSVLCLHKDIYSLSYTYRQNQRRARWPLPHHYQTHTTNSLRRERSGQIELERSRVATSSSLLDLLTER